MTNKHEVTIEPGWGCWMLVSLCMGYGLGFFFVIEAFLDLLKRYLFPEAS